MTRPATEELVVNGGFEEGNDGWTISTSSSMDVIVSPEDAFSGNAFAQFGSIGSQGMRSQTLTTIAGTTYIVDFHLACRSSETGTPNSFVFAVGGVEKFSVIITGEGSHDYITHTYPFTAWSPSTTIYFFSQQDESSYFYLDDVSVVPLPADLSNDYLNQPQLDDGSAVSTFASHLEVFSSHPNSDDIPHRVANLDFTSTPETMIIAGSAMGIMVFFCLLALAAMLHTRSKKENRMETFSEKIDDCGLVRASDHVDRGILFLTGQATTFC